MDNLSPRKFIAAVIIVSAVTSSAVSLAIISALVGLRPGEAVRRITPGAGAPSEAARDREIAERVLRQDELVVAVVKRVSPSVVSIVATKNVPVVEQFFINPFKGDPFFEQFFGDGGLGIPQFRQKGTRKQEVGAGTGFIVSSDGLILTNKHVVADTAAEYTVFLNDGTKIPASVLARDPAQDLAVLKIEKSGLAAVNLGDSSQVQIGQSVIAIGNALGEFRNTVS